MSSKTAPHVLIIGGGYAGVELAKLLDKAKNVTVTLVEKKEFFHHCVASPRAFVEEAVIEKSLMPLNKLFKNPNNKVVHADVISLSKDQATLENGEIIKFDYIVIATGSFTTEPIKTQQRQMAQAAASIHTTFEDIKNAESILIIGGGAVGVEIASEIATEYPKKKVTIIHSGDKLAPGPFAPKYFARLEAGLKALKVETIMSDKISVPSDFDGRSKKTLTTEKGVTIESDFQLVCTGVRPNSQLIANMDPKLVDFKKSIIVNERLQFKDADYSNFFAIGDVAGTGEMKLAITAGMHSAYLSKLLLTLAAGKPITSVKPYKLNPGVLGLVTLGRNGGVMSTPIGVFGNGLARLKSKDMFIAKKRGELNL